MQLEALLEQVKTGSLSVEEAARALKAAPFADLDYAKVDLHRQLRQGVSEVIDFVSIIWQCRIQSCS